MPFFDEIAKRSGQIITFVSVATGVEVSFPAFIKEFSDNFSVSWNGSSPFGRTDPIKNYVGTTRSISCAFDILAKNREQAVENFRNYGKLIQMLYPVFSEQIGASEKYRTIKAGPLMRIKYANYIRAVNSDQGLLGCINGFTFNPVFASGHFLNDQNEMIPINYSVSISFEPFHEKTIGSDVDDNILENTFPYNQDQQSKKRSIIPGDLSNIL